MSQRTKKSQRSEERNTKFTLQESLHRAQLIHDISKINNSIRKEEEALILSQSPKKLTHLIQKQDENFNQIETASDLSRDCETLTKISQIAVAQVSSASLSSKSINLPNIITNLLTKYGDDAGGLNFEKIGEWGLRNSRVVASATSFLFGLGQFQPIRKERARTQRSQKDKIEEMKSVDLKEMKKNRADELMTRAKRLCEKLKKEGDTPLTTIITAQSSFAQTVENAFDLAHLVRDGYVGISAENGSIYAKAGETRKIEENSSRKQCVLHLRQPDYKKIIDGAEGAHQFQGDDIANCE